MKKHCFLNLILPNRILSYAKIVKGERNSNLSYPESALSRRS